MSQRTPRTFRNLFDIEDFRGIEIPIIQRDYAQGRTTATDIRNQFIHALYEALMLPPDSPELPLDLDFIYGSLDKSDLGTVFAPLDGQQRLTALFLLHWYLAVHDGKLPDFQAFMCRGQQSRFSYKVRASADDFFDTLSNADFELPAPGESEDEGDCVITRAIEDQPWFFLAWRQDPTVMSALSVLDTIHEQFKDTEGLFERLLDRDQPVITFQFLNLHDFGLSDELYIKMNARGKALTEYEAFKALLEQKIDRLLHGRTYHLQGRRVLPREYFAHRVDSAWADLFWHHRAEGTRTFDKQFMNFVRGLVTVTFPHARREEDPENVNATMRNLSDNREHYNFYRYDTEGCLSTDFADMLISILDQLSSNGQELRPLLPNADYYDEGDMFVRVLLRADRGAQRVLQAEWIQFYGYCIYLHKFSPDEQDERLAEWMRLVSNLALNTIINRTHDFIRALVGVRRLLEEVGDTPLIDYVAGRREPVSGLNQQQWREEHLKAQLMRRDVRWRNLLLMAETHGYFRGQIEFLLDFSDMLEPWKDSSACDWNDEEDENYRAAFREQYEKGAAVFDDKGLRKFDNFVWERTLLTFGDYLLQNGRNRSLLDNKDRDASWKRLLRGSDKGDDDPRARKRKLVRYALSCVDHSDVQGSLDRRIRDYLATTETAPTACWRRMLVECPAAIDYCEQRFLRDTDHDGLFLLKKKYTSAYHAELHTYHLHRVIIPRMKDRGELEAFTSFDYEDVYYERRLPRVRLLAEKLGIEVSICFHSDRFQLQIELKEQPPEDLLNSVCNELGFFNSADEDLVAGKCVLIHDVTYELHALSDYILTSLISGSSG